jgi:hypothetical protein
MRTLRAFGITGILLFVMLLDGCGKRFSGTFIGNVSFGGGLAMAEFAVEFSPSGTAFVRALGQEHAGKYRIEGQKIILEMPTDTTVFTIVDSDTLKANMNGEVVFKRKG